MNKLSKRTKLIILNILLIIITLVNLFVQPFCAVSTIVLFIFLALGVVLFPAMIILSVFSALKIKNNDKNGCLLTYLGGFIGGLIGIIFLNKDYAYKEKIIIAANIWVYPVIIYPLSVALLFAIGFYQMW